MITSTSSLSSTATGPDAGPGAAAPSAAQRILRAARLLFANKSTLIGMPLMILGIIFVATYLVWLLVSVNVARAGGTPDGTDIYVGGGSFFVVIYMLVAAIQAMSLTFRFAQGFSVTRRDFYLGSALAFLGLSAGYAAIMAVFGWIEDLTDGWGLHGQMFSLHYLGLTSPLETFLVFFFSILFCSVVGMAVATLYVRWRAWGILGFFAGLVFLIIGLLTLFTLSNAWPQVGAWLVTSGTVGVATWLLLPTLIAGVIGYFVLRRATPAA